MTWLPTRRKTSKTSTRPLSKTPNSTLMQRSLLKHPTRRGMTAHHQPSEWRLRVMKSPQSLPREKRRRRRIRKTTKKTDYGVVMYEPSLSPGKLLLGEGGRAFTVIKKIVVVFGVCVIH